MQHRRPLLLALVAALLAAGPAAAQDKPKRRPIPPPRPAATEPATTPAAATVQTPSPFAAGGLSAPARPVRLVGLAPVGDAAPACRAQCSKDRYVCHAAGDPTDCDSRWIPCLQACSAH